MPKDRCMHCNLRDLGQENGVIRGSQQLVSKPYGRILYARSILRCAHIYFLGYVYSFDDLKG